MAERTGKCINYTTCTLAYRNQPITVTGDFICPECGKPLQGITPTKPAAKFQFPSQKHLIIAGGIALVVVIFLMVSGGGDKTADDNKTRAEDKQMVPQPEATPSPLATPTPATDLAQDTPPSPETVPLATPPPAEPPTRRSRLPKP